MLDILNYSLIYQESNYSTLPENDKMAHLTSLHPDYTPKGGIGLVFPHLQTLWLIKNSTWLYSYIIFLLILL